MIFLAVKGREYDEGIVVYARKCEIIHKSTSELAGPRFGSHQEQLRELEGLKLAMDFVIQMHYGGISMWR